MKKIYCLLAGFAMLFSSCDDKLDIVPKGDTTLASVSDLETILNQPWLLYYQRGFELDNMIANSTPQWRRMGDMVNQKQEDYYAYMFCDETIDRADLATDDGLYRDLYEYINYMNVVISKMPDATGDESQKPRIIAEARVMRAYLHFLAVNLYARQYDDATASTLGGIAYVDNTDVSVQKTKLPLDQVYAKALEDCSDDVLACLKQTAVDNSSRFEADFGYGVRARILFQMKHYDEALKYANLALGVNGTIEDRSEIANTATWLKYEDAPNNYLYITFLNQENAGEMSGYTITPAALSLYEPGDYVRYYSREEDWDDNMGRTYGVEGSMVYSGDARVNPFGMRAEQMYYVAAECLIRKGQYAEGLKLIDKVREKRIHPSKYASLTTRDGADTEAGAMKMLQDCKRIEMLCTYETFFDLKRWNSEPAYASPCVHDYKDYGTYTMNPESPLWVLPFPQNAVNFNSSLTQNF